MITLPRWGEAVGVPPRGTNGRGPAAGSNGASTLVAAPPLLTRRPWKLVRLGAYYVLSRVVTLAGVFVASVSHPGRGIMTILTSFDGGWYLLVSRHGYPAHLPPAGATGLSAQSTLAFFPLYPLCIRIVGWLLPVSDRVAALIVSFLAGFVCVVLFWALVNRLFDRATADRAAAVFCFFPGAFVLSLAYSEALMLLLAVACLLFLLDRRWLLAGVSAGLATAVRPAAIALFFACLWEAVSAVRRRQGWRPLLAPALAPLGMAGFFAYLWVHTGSVTAWFQVERTGWQEHNDLGSFTAHTAARFLTDPFRDPRTFVLGLGIAFIVVAGILLARARLPAILNIYTVVVLALVLTSSVLSARPRFLFAAFPLVIGVARPLRGRALTGALIASAAGTALLTGFYGVWNVIPP